MNVPMSGGQFYLMAGLLVVLAAWIPLFTRGVPLSLAMISVACGMIMPALVNVQHPLVHYSTLIEHVAEFALVVSVLAAGLSIGRSVSISGWQNTWRLLIVMLVWITLVCALAMSILQMSFGYALVAAAALSPTDPVLTGNLPGSNESSDAREMKFALTSEAGLNDGLAFPFVVLGIVCATSGMTPAAFARWAAIDLIWNVGGAVALGFMLGRGLISLNARLPARLRLARSESGLVAVGLAFLAYGTALLLSCNGFIATFVEAVTLRSSAASFEYGNRLRHAASQFERVAMVGILAFMGVSISHGMLAAATLQEVVFVAFSLVVARPVCTFLVFTGSDTSWRLRSILGYLGVRGIASIYYATYLLSETQLEDAERLVRIIGLFVLGSVVLHGATTDWSVRKFLLRDESGNSDGPEGVIAAGANSADVCYARNEAEENRCREHAAHQHSPKS